MSTSHLPYQGWQATRLWAELGIKSGPEAEECRNLIEGCLPEIERILRSGGTSPLDFTLHDDGHSYRVAQRIAEIIPKDVLAELSEYEIALLLLSAYLHDIGMTPARRKVTDHLEYLKTGDTSLLSLNEKVELQKWLDDHGYGIPGKTAVKGYTEETVSLEQVLTHYCRHKHNDWSEEWIRERLGNRIWRGYIGWLDDLVQLCRSHHYGYHHLKTNAFDPKLVATKVVHRRYLACCLRIGDILEFDPERTPDVIFKHRGITKGSQIFWYKDHHINCIIDLEKQHIFITAEPPNAKIHRAIEQVINDIDAELVLCQRLAAETHFDKFGPISLKHKWGLPYVVDRHINPYNNCYEYINGAFRPNTERLLQLLSGKELYGSPFAAVRELLQNAFDATRELIAHELLALPRTDSFKRCIFSEKYPVELSVEPEDDRFTLVCKDQGVGMSKQIIENYLLVSGSSRRHDILELERQCETIGIRLGRTGQFGIGVLSYFMMADRIQIYTRRHNLCGDVEPSGWEFESEGIGTFGELKRSDRRNQGTEIRLRLRPEMLGQDPEEFVHDLQEYLRAVLVRLPCALIFKADCLNREPLIIGPGWAKSEKMLSDLLLRRVGAERSYRRESVPKELLPIERQQQLEALDKHWNDVRGEIAAVLKWHSFEGELPNSMGAFRLNVPYFKLPRGNSLAFLRVKNQSGNIILHQVGQGLAFFPQPESTSAWRGMIVGDEQRSDLQSYFSIQRRLGNVGLIEIDWEARESGSISVNRDHLSPSKEANVAKEWLIRAIKQEYRNLLGTWNRSPYSYLSYRHAELNTPDDVECYWVHFSNSNQQTDSLSHINFPVIPSMMFVYQSRLPELKYIEDSVEILPSLRGSDDRLHYTGLGWAPKTLQPDKILLLKSYSNRPVPIWEKPASSASFSPSFLKARFPDSWFEVCGVWLTDYPNISAKTMVWNVKHPLVSKFDTAGWEWVTTNMNSSTDPIAIGDKLLESQSRSAAWVADCLEKRASDLWQGIVDREPQFLRKIWTLLFGDLASSLKLKVWMEIDYGPGISLVSPDQWTYLKENHTRRDPKLIPDVSSDWLLIDTEYEARQSRFPVRHSSNPRDI